MTKKAFYDILSKSLFTAENYQYCLHCIFMADVGTYTELQPTKWKIFG